MSALEDRQPKAASPLWRHGYEGASMAELTKAMGLNSPSIYVAWGSKRGLFDAVLKRYRERRAAHREYVLAGATPREVAERTLFGAIDWLVDPNLPRGCLTIQAKLYCGNRMRLSLSGPSSLNERPPLRSAWCGGLPRLRP
jgi:AcrR family transcriptional regulator